LTLVAGGLTLPIVVRRLRISINAEEQIALKRALARSYEAALTRIRQLIGSGAIESARAIALEHQFEHLRDALNVSADTTPGAAHAQHADAEREITAAQRQAVIEMRERGEIDNVVMRQVLSNLDLMASRLSLSVGEG
jgi:CPA1 family monovalent cation:H+ antiporter